MTPAPALNDLDHWFATEILPHEGALTRYLRRVWHNPAEVPDFRQEVYVRILQSAAKALPTSPKSFLFATARNLLADRIRRERIVSIDYAQDSDSFNVLIDELTPDQRLNARQELRRLSDAFDQLTDRAREVIWLRRIEGLSQRETAERLGLREGTIEAHLCRGLRALMKATLTNESNSAGKESRTADEESDTEESQHG